MDKNKNPAQKSNKNLFSSVRWTLVIYDLLCFLCVDLLLLVIFDGSENLEIGEIVYHGVLSALCITVMRFICKIYSQIWRYGGIQSYIRLMMSDAFGFVLYFLLQLVLPPERISFARIVALCALNLLGALAMRMLYRYAYKCNRKNIYGKILCKLVYVFTGRRVENGASEDTRKIKIAILGAGRVGVSLAEELLNNARAAYVPKCFIDIKSDKIGREIHGIPVFSEESDIFDTLRTYEIQEIVIAVPMMDAVGKRALYDYYKRSGCKVKVYDFPVMQSAKSSKRAVREFDIEELLFRKPVLVADDLSTAYYRDKVILITGGGGSIGSELCRQIAAMKPGKLVILDVYENGAYDIQQELRIAYGANIDISVEILSVCNRSSLDKVFESYHPDIVLHAAAHKHVPLMEHNCCEAVANNVFGTLNVVRAVEKFGTPRFIMVSTDKAVNPTNVMGATKRMCEMIVGTHSTLNSKTVYSATRFGNVLGSAGSVIPLFRKQIAAGGPVTLTDKRIIRYFMTIPEASQLVLQSGAMAHNGELFVLDMGKPIKILELAESMIRLSGYEPYTDIDIKEIGLRPGEKLYEELLIRTEELGKTQNSLIFTEKDMPVSMEELTAKLQILHEALQSGDDLAVKEALHKVVPTYKNPETVNAAASDAKEMSMV